MYESNDLTKTIWRFFDTPITSVFLEQDTVGHIEKLIFCRKDNLFLNLTNEMIELSERLEEGTLVAEITRNLTKNPPSKKIIFSAEMQVKRTSLRFLLHKSNGNLNPAGLFFNSINNKENYIVAGAAPFTLVLISDIYSESKLPEYDVSQYEKEDLEEI